MGRVFAVTRPYSNGRQFVSCVFAACLFSGLAAAQVLSVVNGAATPAATPFGTAAGATGGFNGAFEPSLPLYHVGGRGETGFDIVWNFQPNWQAYKQFAGSTPRRLGSAYANDQRRLRAALASEHL